MVTISPQWVIRGHVDPALLPGTKFSPTFRSLMWSRGIEDPDELMSFLCPHLGQLRNPMAMKGIPRACERIVEAIKAEETIGVFTDYDVDGVCSAALLHRFLVHIGCRPPMIFIPDRITEGYGLNMRGIKELHDEGVTLLITADCGITARQEVAHAGSLGMSVIITDHHEPNGLVPDAHSVINPKQSGCMFKGEDLCGAGVVFHLIVALRTLLRELGWNNLPNLRDELDLVAMATVADAVSLDGVNRILVKEGLNVLNSSGRVGISALVKVSGIRKEVLSRDLGFILSPRINAAGRIADAKKAFHLLTTQHEQEAILLATELDKLNRLRQMHEQKVIEQALNFLEESHQLEGVTVVAHQDWHIGVLGIVASRLVSLFSRPAIVLSIVNGVGIGSGRSISGIDLHASLSEVSDLLREYGGHKMAVGLSIDEENIANFSLALNEVILRESTDMASPFEVDLQISPLDLTPALMDELELLSPFGEGNPEPVFYMPGMEIVSRRKDKSGMVKLILRHSNRTFHTLRCSLDDKV
ncbi:MAG: single-stranded-DNA-specific exonuclease RecJ, partial [Desulfomonilia bacterium]|nr:single-stranded-DNA-specific exonuclease RecJ [Desulfomonilia bacterium]